MTISSVVEVPTLSPFCVDFDSEKFLDVDFESPFASDIPCVSVDPFVSEELSPFELPSEPLCVSIAFPDALFSLWVDCDVPLLLPESVRLIVPAH